MKAKTIKKTFEKEKREIIKRVGDSIRNHPHVKAFREYEKAKKRNFNTVEEYLLDDPVYLSQNVLIASVEATAVFNEREAKRLIAVATGKGLPKQK